jgi:hypothetical protein
MTAILTLLGTTSFIIGFLVVAALLIAILLEFEREGWATTFFSLALALVFWNFKEDIWNFVSSKPWQTVAFAAFYVVSGIVWSFFKWRNYVLKTLGRIKDVKTSFLSIHKEINDKNRGEFNKQLDDLKLKDSDGYSISVYDKTTLEDFVSKVTPIASKKKTLITSWISYWPISLSATLLNNPFRQFFSWIYDNLSGYYDKMTNKYKQDILG